MTTCEDCLAVRNLSLEPRVQGAVCGGCAAKLSNRVRDLEAGLRQIEARAREAANQIGPDKIGLNWARGIEREARRLLGLEVDRG